MEFFYVFFLLLRVHINVQDRHIEFIDTQKIFTNEKTLIFLNNNIIITKNNNEGQYTKNPKHKLTGNTQSYNQPTTVQCAHRLASAPQMTWSL